MKDEFKTYLTDKIRLSNAELDLIESVATSKRLRKRQYLLHEGSVWQSYAFVCQGCLRAYRTEEDGSESILYFLTENWWTGDPESLFWGTPSKLNIEALEDSELLIFSVDNFAMLKKEIPAFGALIYELTCRSIVSYQNRIHELISYSAEKRYHNFIATFPKVANRIPQHMIASYLGLSPDTISRSGSRQPGKLKPIDVGGFDIFLSVAKFCNSVLFNSWLVQVTAYHFIDRKCLANKSPVSYDKAFVRKICLNKIRIPVHPFLPLRSRFQPASYLLKFRHRPAIFTM